MKRIKNAPKYKDNIVRSPSVPERFPSITLVKGDGGLYLVNESSEILEFVSSKPLGANQDAKTPMRFAMIGVAANIILAVLLMQPLGYIGLALATALASFLNVGLLWWSIRKQQGSILDAPSILRMFRALIASIVMLATLYGLQQLWAFPNDKTEQFFWLTSTVTSGMLTYFLSAYLLGERLWKSPTHTV